MIAAWPSASRQGAVRRWSVVRGGCDRLDLAAALRSQVRMADAVVLLQTSYAELDRQTARDAGVDSVLVKPIRQDKLEEASAAIRRLVRS